MASKEHMRIIGRGKKQWNQWREKNEKIRPGLRDARLSAEDTGESQAGRVVPEGGVEPPRG